MNFITFPVSSTNIFPIANSTTGGQLLSEWNLRSRETVATDAEVLYDIGPSYTHSVNDFKIQAHTDSVNTLISSTELEITAGKAVVNGHFIQLLAPMVIDLAQANAEAQLNSQPPLRGRLGVGLRVMYSTETTMAGSMVTEDSENMFAGIQVVILPPDELIDPHDSPTDESAITCHLKLGTFDFVNGAIQNVIDNPEKTRYIDGDRISNMDKLLSDQYLSKSGLNPKKLYVFSGKSAASTQDTWCEATDSLIVWDKNPQITLETPTSQAVFTTSASGDRVNLILPHKQIDGMVDTQGRPQYFKDKILEFPVADYDANTAGTVTPEYTKNIKTLAGKLSNIYQLAKGKQVAYRDSIASMQDLPKINPKWDIGDYVLVKEDYTVLGDASSYSSPSTIYAVIPGYVSGISYFGMSEDSDDIPEGLEGVELEELSVSAKVVEERTVAGDSLGLHRLPKFPVASQTATLVLSGSVVYQVKHSDLFNDDGTPLDSFTILSNYNVSRDKTALISTNPNFASHYGSNPDTYTTFGNKYVTFRRIDKPVSTDSNGDSKYSWEECGISVGDTIIIVVDKTANIESGGIPGATLQLISGVDFNPITGEILNSAVNELYTVLDTIDYVSPKAVYKYYYVTQPDLFSDFDTFRGKKGEDYFVAKYEYTTPNDDNTETAHYIKYYFVVSDAQPNEWSGTIQLTGQVPFAGESAVGGFLNIPTTSQYADGGYVYLDDAGHLRLRDYAILRSGTLAYQLGEDIEEFGGGEALASIQATLDEVINDRVAFPSQAQLKKSSTPNVINVTINLSDDDQESDEDSGIRSIYIRNIDSRFNTSVYFHFTGTATKKTIINFVDCERIRIDSNVCGQAINNVYTAGPIINVYRCGLYYDPAIMNYIATCDRDYNTEFYNRQFTNEEDVIYTDYYPSWFTGMKDIKLWYQAYEETDPQLTVDNMTVSELDVALESEDVDFWTPAAPNDNHYATALSSLTFAGDGTIIGCGLLVSNNSTDNVTQDDTIILGKFTLPQGSGLIYPQGCLTRQLKVTGTFTSAYFTDSGWLVSETSFTALSEKYDRYSATMVTEATGSIAFHEKVKLINATLGSDVEVGGIAPWQHDTYNLFYGGIVC